MARRVSRLVEDIDLEYAAHPRKPGTGAGDTNRAQHFLHMPQPRPVPEVAEVDTSAMSWRPSVEWEEAEIDAARKREREAELHLFDGLSS